MRTGLANGTDYRGPESSSGGSGDWERARGRSSPSSLRGMSGDDTVGLEVDDEEEEEEAYAGSLPLPLLGPAGLGLGEVLGLGDILARGEPVLVLPANLGGVRGVTLGALLPGAELCAGAISPVSAPPPGEIPRWAVVYFWAIWNHVQLVTASFNVARRGKVSVALAGRTSRKAVKTWEVG